MKKAVLGLTLALTMSTAIACSPNADNQGAVDDTTYRGAGYQQDQNQTGFRGTSLNQGRGQLGNTNYGTRGGTLGNNGNRGMLGDTNNTRMGRGGFLNGGAGTRMGTAQTEDYGNYNGGLGYGTGQNRFGNRNNQNGIFGNGGNDQNTARNLERRVERINGVDDATVVVYGNDIIVGVDSNDNQRNINQKVRQEIQQEATGRQIHVTNDEDLFNRLGDVNTRLQQGNSPMNDVGNDVRGLLDDIGRGVTAPFRNR